MSEPKNTKSMLLALLFFIGAGALLLMSISAEDNDKKASKVNSQAYEERVNNHLMMTNQKMELQRERAMVENNKYAPDFRDTKAGNAYSNGNLGVDLSVEGHATEVANELGRGERESRAPQNPHELIQSEIFNQQQYQEYTQAYKEDYAKKFVENAARNGWRLKLNDDFKVISVTPLRNPSSGPSFNSQMQLFDSGGGSAQ